MKREILLVLLGLITLTGCGGNSGGTTTTNIGAASGVAATNGSQFGNAKFGSAKF